MFIAGGLQGARHDSHKKEMKENREINSKLGFYFLKLLLNADEGETLKTFRDVLFMKRLSLGIYQRKIKAHKFV